MRRLREAISGAVDIEEIKDGLGGIAHGVVEVWPLE